MADHRGPPSGGGQPPRPQRDLLHLALVADPLRLDAVRDQVVGEAGGGLDAGVPPEQLLDERPRRGPALDVEGAPLADRRAGSANATANGVVSTVVASLTITAPARPSASRFACATATRTGSTSTPAQVIPARENAIRSPPMPQPRSMTDSRRGGGQPRRAVRRDRRARRLLEPLGGEVHAGRELAELGLGPAPQLHLGERRRDLLGGGATPEGGLGRQLVAGRLGGARQQPLPVLGEQPAERLEIHPTDPSREPADRGAGVVHSSPTRGRRA